MPAASAHSPFCLEHSPSQPCTCPRHRLCVLSHSVPSDSAASWTVAHQALLSMEFSRQEYGSGLSFPLPGESSGPRDRTQVSCVSCIGKRILYHYCHLSESEVKLLSRVRLFATPWTVAYQAPLSMGFSRQEYWSGLPFPSPGDHPDPGIEPRSPTL